MDRYKLCEQIGDGSFGRVMKATRMEDGEVVSVVGCAVELVLCSAC
jgi:hypothetical protein